MEHLTQGQLTEAIILYNTTVLNEKDHLEKEAFESQENSKGSKGTILTKLEEVHYFHTLSYTYIDTPSSIYLLSSPKK